MFHTRQIVLLMLCGSALVALAGCKTVGWRFPHDTMDIMMVGDTSVEEVRILLGEPYQVGNRNGRIVWTYVDYHFSLFGDPRLRNLRLEFDDGQRLVTVEYNTNIPGEAEAFRERVTR